MWPRTTKCDMSLPERIYFSFGEIASQSRGGSVEVSELGGAGWGMQRKTMRMKTF